MSLRRVLALGALSVFLVLFLAPGAQAHTQLVESTPTSGATLNRLPAQEILGFDEEVIAADLTVRVGAKVLPVHEVPPSLTSLAVDLRSVKAAKTVRLTWRLVSSQDGHASSGMVTLHVRSAPLATSASGQAPGPAAIEWLSIGGHVLGYLAMAVLVGGLFFVSVLWPSGAGVRRTKVLLVAAVGAGVLSAVSSVAVVLWRASGSMTLTTALTEDFGRAAAATALLWMLASVVVVAVLQRGEIVVRLLAWRVGALVVAVGLLRTTGMDAHAGETSSPAWGVAADFLHLGAVSAWVGGLTVLSVCLLPRRQLDELAEVVPRFSKVAMVSVLMLVSSGLILVWRIIGPVDGFWETHYARVLLVKLSLFALVMLAAMVSKRWVETTLARAVATRRSTAVRSFATSVAAETVLVIAVLGAASVLVTSSPGA